jgi:hypothetical protein
MSIEDKIGRLRRAMYSRKVPATFGEEVRHTLPRELSDTPDDWARPEESRPVSGTIAAPRAIRYTRRILVWILGIAVLFFLAAAAAFAWYLAGGFGTDVRGNNIDIAINGPLSVIGGEPAELQIVVTNRNKAPLEFADLVIDYPQGTRSVTDFATSLPSQRISLGTIDAGGTRQGTVNAILVGQGGAAGVVHVSVEYQVSGTSAIFTAAKDYPFTFAASPVAISLDSNTEAIPGQPMTLVATVTANTNTLLRDVLLQLDPPFGFTMSGSDPAPSGTNIWKLGDLRPGDVKVITIQGVMKGQPGDARTFHFSVGTVQATSSAMGVPLVSYDQTVTIAQPFIGLTVAVNGTSGTNASVVQPNGTVNVAINWKNELATPINNAVFVASLDGFPIDGTKIVPTDGFYRSADNTIEWDSSTSHGTLGTLSPGSSGSVNFTFQVPPDANLANLHNPSLNITIHAAGDRTDQNNVPQNLQSSVVRTIRVETTPTVLAQGFYHTNPFGVSGSVPPKVNKDTVYAILWTLGNSTNPISNAVMKAQLPPYVRWSGVFSPNTENLTFNQKDGTVTWDIGNVAAGAGSTGTASRQVAFEISLTPSSSQVGDTPALILNQSFSGTDSFTGTTLSQKIANTTTIQPNDPGFVDSEAKVIP